MTDRIPASKVGKSPGTRPINSSISFVLFGWISWLDFVRRHSAVAVPASNSGVVSPALRPGTSIPATYRTRLVLSERLWRLIITRSKGMSFATAFEKPSKTSSMFGVEPIMRPISATNAFSWASLLASSSLRRSASSVRLRSVMSLKQTKRTFLPASVINTGLKSVKHTVPSFRLNLISVRTPPSSPRNLPICSKIKGKSSGGWRSAISRFKSSSCAKPKIFEHPVLHITNFLVSKSITNIPSLALSKIVLNFRSDSFSASSARLRSVMSLMLDRIIFSPPIMMSSAEKSPMTASPVLFRKLSSIPSTLPVLDRASTTAA